MFHKWIGLSVVFLGVVAVMGYVMSRRESVDALWRSYQERYSIQSQDFSYRFSARPIFGNGILFYQVSFPYFQSVHKVDKMAIRSENNAVRIDLQGVHLNVIDSLKKNKSDQIQSVLKKYVPFQDILKYPLESLALAGFYQLKGDVSVLVTPLDNQRAHLKGYMKFPHVTDVMFDVYVSHIQGSTFFDFVSGVPEKMEISVKDRGGVSEYGAYADAVGYMMPERWRALLEHKTFMPINISSQKSIRGLLN